MLPCCVLAMCMCWCMSGSMKFFWSQPCAAMFPTVVVLIKHQWVGWELGAQAEVNLVTALVPSDTACLASSPGRMRRTAVWISRLVTVGFLE